MGFEVIHFRMFTKNPGNVRRQRAVHKYRNPRDLLVVIQFMKYI